MKRLALAAALFTLTIACNPAHEPPRRAAKLEAPARPAETASVVFEVPDDPWAGVLPVGLFPDVPLLCDAQMKVGALRIAEANEARAEDHLGFDLVPSCVEKPAALANVKASLGGAILDAKAIAVETGSSETTFLVLRTAEGWTAVREAFLADAHEDPGCPSIEREDAIVELRLEESALVVLTTADRAFYGEHDEGTLLLTHARACRLTEWGPTCGPIETVSATLAHQDAKDPEAPPATRQVFSTTFTVDRSGALTPAARFDETAF